MTATAKAKETSIVTLKNVVFMYTSVSRPVEQLNTDNKPPLSDDELEFHSFEIKILISEERFKKLKKAYKGAKNFANAKEYTAEEVTEKFGEEILTKLNSGEEGSEDFVMIKFSQTCLVGPAAKRRPSFPITQIGIKGRVQDMNGNTIDQETSVGNGTIGHFQFKPVESKNGLYLYPKLLCIIDLEEYVSTVEEDEESLGLEELDEVDTENMAVEEEGSGDDFIESEF